MSTAGPPEEVTQEGLTRSSRSRRIQTEFGRFAAFWLQRCQSEFAYTLVAAKSNPTGYILHDSPTRPEYERLSNFGLTGQDHRHRLPVDGDEHRGTGGHGKTRARRRPWWPAARAAGRMRRGWPRR
jgi:hypothetical protein